MCVRVCLCEIDRINKNLVVQRQRVLYPYSECFGIVKDIDKHSENPLCVCYLTVLQFYFSLHGDTHYNLSVCLIRCMIWTFPVIYPFQVSWVS